MSKTVLLQSTYTLGAIRDKARHLLPQGSAWLIQDWIPDHRGPLRGRGPWLSASPDLAEAGGATSVPAVAWAPFATGSQLIAITSNNSLWKVDNPTTATDKGNATVPAQRPAFYKELLIIPGSNGATTPFKYDGSAAPAALGGTPPQGIFVDVYKDRLVLARDSSNPRRLWFSSPGDPQAWDTTNGWLNVSRPITGIAAMTNQLLVWNIGSMERIRGSTPPPSKEMQLEPMFEQGLSDARSIVKMGDQVVWANTQGVWLTDGAGVTDITKAYGAKRFWAETVASLTQPVSMAAGEFNGVYIVCLSNGTNGIVFCFDTTRQIWWTFTNVVSKMFAEPVGAIPELYFGHTGASGVRLGSMAQCWNRIVTDTASADAFGTGPTPILETVFYRGEPGYRRIKNLFVGIKYSGTGYVQLSTITQEDEAALVGLGETPPYQIIKDLEGNNLQIGPKANYQRVKAPMYRVGSGFALKVQLVGDSKELILYDIEAEIRELESSKRRLAAS